MKLYPKYKDSGIEWIGDVPEHWSALRLKWVCNFLYGKSLSAQEREDGTIPVYGSNGIVGYHNRSITEKPCIIVGRKGSFGKVTFSEKKCYPIDTTYYIDCTSTKNYMRWLWYLLPLLKMDEFSRDSAVPGLNREDAYRNIITLPSSYEQKQIAAYLVRKTAQIDNLISKKQKLIELLKEERSAIINQAVTKGLNPDAPMKDSGIEWQGKVPEKWEVKRLKFVLDFKSGNGITATLIKNDGEYAVYGGNGLRGYASSYTHEGSYVLIGRQGALCGNINYAYGKFWASEHAVVATLVSNYNLFWFGELLRTMNLNQYSQSAAQPGLSVDHIKNLFIPVPSPNEQDAIAAYLDRKTTKIDQTITKIEKQIGLLKEFRTALVSEVVTGKIDVRDGGSNG